ncbi:MAG: hypothetical protein ABI156_05380 [Caldimonas sp.]
MSTLVQKSAVAAAMGALLIGGAWAQAVSTLPPVQRSGQVEYLSGGIGDAESTAIQSAARKWPLTLEFAVKDKQRADFAADVSVIVRDTHGHTALQTESAGPFLLARLAPGRYAVDATFAGKTLHENVTVAHGTPAKAVFVWPAGTDEKRS